VIHFPEVADKGDVSDWISAGSTFDDLKARVVAAEMWQPAERADSKADDEPKAEESEADEPEAASAENKLPHGYSFTGRGLMHNSNKPDEPPTHVAGCFDIVAMTRDGDGSSWGLLLHWRDDDGRDYRFALPREMLAGDGADARRVLMKQGFFIGASQKARMLFNTFLLEVKSPNRARATEHIGWHDGAYVLPDTSYGGDPRETLLLQSATAHEHSFRQSGSLEDWQQNVACYAVGNSRLAFMISAAFAGVLIEPCSAEGGGFHVIGSSSTGKTTGLRVAASVWGDPSYMKTWRATSNGLEGVAKNHCDGLLCLDEIAQISSREAGEAAYMLAHGQGKARSKTDGEARKLAQWRILFLSTGEISLASKVAEDGTRRKTTAGQQVRVVDIPADAGACMGIFENLHGFRSGKALSIHLCSTVKWQHGTAGRAFLAAIVPQIDEIRKDVPVMMQNFCTELVPAGADGQVTRVAHVRFPGVHALLQHQEGWRRLPTRAQDTEKANESQAPGDQGNTTTAQAYADRRAGTVARGHDERPFRLLRGTDQHIPAVGLPLSHQHHLVPKSAATQPAASADVGTDGPTYQAVPTDTARAAPVAKVGPKMTPAPAYGLRTKYSRVFGGPPGYMLDRMTILGELAAFIAQERKSFG
jgi:putative DNA primase/helicase